MVRDLRSAQRRAKCLFFTGTKVEEKLAKELRKYKNLYNHVKPIKTQKWVIIHGKGQPDPCAQRRGSVAKDVLATNAQRPDSMAR